ncbi:MAG: DUF2842 domain-containing protein [Pseudomonadota bacterium]
MNPRLRKLVGSLAMLAFLFVWVVVALSLADRLPTHWLAQLAFFIVAGLGWGLPLIPLMRWMNR